MVVQPTVVWIQTDTGSKGHTVSTSRTPYIFVENRNCGGLLYSLTVSYSSRETLLETEAVIARRVLPLSFFEGRGAGRCVEHNSEKAGTLNIVDASLASYASGCDDSVVRALGVWGGRQVRETFAYRADLPRSCTPRLALPRGDGTSFAVCSSRALPPFTVSFVCCWSPQRA